MGALMADELTIDPPEILDSPCAPCLPPRCCGAPLIALPQASVSEDVVIDLCNPIYSDGVLSTEEGGTLIAEGIRIQAQKIVYTRKMDSTPPIFSVCCEGDLLVDYGQRTLVGESLSFDFLTNSGILVGGRTALPPWYIGGDVVELCENGDILVHAGYITTSEGGEESVALRTPFLVITQDRVLTARNITFEVNHVPIFWFPKISLDLNQRFESPFMVTFGWGGYPGTHIGIRYQFLNWHDLNAYARLDAFLGQGIGGGIETEYCPADSPVEWYSRNYYANDLAIFDPKRKDRYRFQGTYFNRLWERTTVNAAYDFVSDGEMAIEYNTDDFEINTAGRTEVELRTQDDFWIARLFADIRVNSFQSINQQLPQAIWTWHPFELGESGIIAENLVKMGYLSYAAADQIPDGPNFRSGRFELRPYLYRPFFLGPLTATPEAGFIGIAYSNGPNGEAVGQALGDLGLRFETALTNYYGCLKHTSEPYAHYHVLTTPRSSIDHHYIFTLEDSYTTLQLLRFGFRQSFFYKTNCAISRPLWIDLWANAFFDVHTIPQAIPKGYADLEWQPFETLLVGVDSCWNFEEKQLDFCNLRTDWTLSQDIAFGVEYRHRGRFAWRKADFYNFVLEAARNQDELLTTAISDRRSTFLARIVYRLNPDWTLKFVYRHGWNRLIAEQTQPSYTEYDIEATTIVFEHWRLGFSYEAREADNRFAFTLKLAPSPP